MYGKPMRTQSGRQGFTPSKFAPMGQIMMPAPAIVSPGPVAPMVIQRDPAFLFPQTQPVFVTEAAPEMSSDTKVVIGVGAAIALLAIGAAL